MVVDFDDFGASKVISDMCRSHDCRDKLDELHYFQPNLKVTLFTIPAYMTIELADWCKANQSWIELAIHGFWHTSNYECEKWTYSDTDSYMKQAQEVWPNLFTRGFKAPGWQISDDCYRWLKDNDFWVADQSYNNSRRPEELSAYINDNGIFSANDVIVKAWHGHTWDCVGNGIYETFPSLKEAVKEVKEFNFVSEVV